jgi:hypothetical protein
MSLNCAQKLWHKFRDLHTVAFFKKVLHEIDDVLELVVKERIRFNLIHTARYLAEHCFNPV